MRVEKTLFILIVILSAVAFAAVGTSISVLYRASFEQQRSRLTEFAQSQARLIEAIARFDAEFSEDHVEGGAAAATLSQVAEASRNSSGFGETGEYVLGKQEGDLIVFLLRQRHSGGGKPEPIPLDGEFAEPMRLALRGLSGTVTAIDYRGEEVLAAYELVAVLNVAIVAKIDLAEVRAPFIRAGAISTAVAFAVILVGALLFRAVVNPITRRMQRAMENLAEAQSLAHVGNWEWDIPADKTTWSDEAYRVFGHEPQEFATSYERFTARVHPDDRAMVDEAIRLAVKEGKAYQIDHRVITPDGAERFVEERGQAFFDSSGKAIRLAGTVQDITERRAAEQALRETEERWNQFTESATESFILLDSDLNLIDINRRGARRFGFETAGEILGRNLVELSPVADQSGRIDLYRNVLSTGSPLHLEGVRIELEGGDRFMNYNVFPVGENLGFIVEDVTDRWAAEESLRKSEEMRRQFMDSATESFVLYDSNLNFLDINAVGLSGLNMNREDVIGKNLAVVVPATKESGRYEKYQSVLATGEPLLMEVVDVHPTRGELVKELKVFRVGDGLGMISQDVTERKAYEEDLRNERNFVASVLDTTGAIAIVVDREGRVVRFNFLANLDKVEAIRSAYPDAAAVAA